MLDFVGSAALARPLNRPSRVNRAHPIARNLIFASDGTANERIRDVESTNPVYVDLGVGGRIGLSSRGVASQGWARILPSSEWAAWNAGNHLTVLTFITPRASFTSSNFRVLMGQGTGVYGWQVAITGYATPELNLVPTWRGTTTATQIVDGLTAHIPTVLCGTLENYGDAASIWTVYKDGKYQSQKTAARIDPAGSIALIIAHASYCLGTNVYGVQHVTLAWNRVLSQAEIAEVSRNPYLLFCDDEQPLYIPDTTTERPILLLDEPKVVTRQPQGSARINWSDPITKGLRGAYLNVSGRMVDAVSGSAPSWDSSSPLATDGEICGRYAGTGNTQFPHRPWQDLGAMSLLVWGRINAATNYSSLVQKQTTNISGINYELRGSYAANDSKVTFYRASSGGYRGHITIGAAWTVGNDVLIGVTTPSDQIEVVPTIYVRDGKGAALNAFTSLGTHGTATGTVLTSTDVLRIGRRYDGVTQLDGDIKLVLLFGRELSKVEVAALNANPWRVFLPLDHSLLEHRDATDLPIFPMSEFGVVNTSQPRF